MKILSALIAALFLLPGLVWGQAAPPAAEVVSAKVDEIFAPWKSKDTPGCAVAVEEGDRKVVSQAYGMADLEHDVPNTPDTVFEAGSVSKQFTAAAVLLLAQQGKLSLQEDVRKYLPELPDYGKTITIDHLLHHTSGLRDWGAVVEIAGWPRGTRVHTHDHVLDIASRQKALNYEPGRYYSYTNTGFNLLVIIAERVSGQTFQEFSRKNIFEPLGMTHTQWRDDFSRIVKGRAIAYSGSTGDFHSEMPFENVFGNGGLLTTVGDLLLWNENFVHGKVGGAALLQELQRRGRLSDGQEIEYARGLFMTKWQGIPEVSHSGATAGYRAFLARYPGQKLSVAVLCNAGPANPVDLAHRTAGLFLGSELKPMTPPTPVQLASEVLAARAGLYRSLRTGMPVRLVVKEGRLQMDEDGPPLVPLSESRFQLGEDTVVEIDMGSDGRSTGMRFVRSSGDVVPFERVAEASPTPEQLAEYVGEYTSDEAEVSYRVVLEDGKLVVRGRPAAAYPLKPLYADGFDADGLLVRFRRDAEGRASGLSLGMPRMWDLRFTRVALSPAAAAPAAGSILIEKVTVVSPEREAPLRDAFVLLEGGRIRSVDTKRPAVAKDVRVIDGGGQFLVPGLIDSHVHVGSPPGVNVLAAAAEDFDEHHGGMMAAFWRQQPRSYLYHGVTAVVDLASPPGSAERFRSAPQAPDLVSCAPLALENGYPAVFLPAELRSRFVVYALPEDPEAAARLVERARQDGYRCIKMFMEDGFGAASSWPLPPEPVVTAIRAEARRLGLPFVLHANALDMQTLALRYKPDVIAHGLWNWGASSGAPDLPEPIRKHLDAVLASGVAYQPTFGVLHGLAALFDPTFLDDPALKKVVPPSLLAWYRTDEAQFFKKELLAESPALADPAVARKAFGGGSSQGERAFAWLAEHGGKILLGSDTPSAPTWADQPGLNTWHELQSMARAGLPLRDLLKAATIRNAEMFGMHDLGTIEPGKTANLLLLRSDPLARVDAWNEIETVILHGELIPRESLAVPGS